MRSRRLFLLLLLLRFRRAICVALGFSFSAYSDLVFVCFRLDLLDKEKTAVANCKEQFSAWST